VRRIKEGQIPRRRCAIYTRKSTEEGLDQEFNSLDAQREACAAYVLSQRHEGWTLLPDHYDDGGFTGGNMERPGLRRLLEAVKAGRVDIIVVYKVDRLTRSLADFAKIVDVLDAAEASFVSVTQSFNTTTSMGRLTLNVLLSFAQFEREVISERVRDKVAASKKKGMWMGGPVPLGYDVRERKLVANDAEATTVCHIMRRYLELGSVPALLDDLRASGVVTKRQTMRDGGIRGGVPFRRGALHHLLKNRIYRGEIVHKGQAYPGDHPPIVDAATFDAVQALLAGNGADRSTARRSAHPSALTGMIRDDAGRPMSPSHAVKGGRRYRYYTSNEATPSESAAPVRRIAAVDLERSLIQATIEALSDDVVLLVGCVDTSAYRLQRFRNACVQLVEKLEGSRGPDLRTILHAIDVRIVVHADRIEASCSRHKLVGLLDPGADTTIPDDRLALALTAYSHRYGRGLRLRLDVADATSRDQKLVALLARARNARDQLLRADLAELKPQARRELARLARSAFLAPDIVSAILEGRHPKMLTARRLERIGNLPSCWQQQRRMLGFVREG
jgi:site-specific DNA recombinase